MATQENVRINFVTSYDGKGLNNAKQQLNGFEALANKAAKTFAGLFAVQKITAFGKASLDAFTADQKAAASLSKTLINLGLGFQSTGVETFIQKLETTTGVLDDQLRPAFATLARSTGSVAKSQQLLNLALDISAGTGKDLGSISTALSKAYLGQTTALGRLGAGLSKTELASKNFSTIQDRLTSLFAGQAATAADTYAGKIAKLTVAYDNLKESVGQGLVIAFEQISGPNGSIDKTTQMIATLGYAISGMVQGFGAGIGLIETIFKKLTDNPIGRFLVNQLKNSFIGKAVTNFVDLGKQAAFTAQQKANTKALEQSYAQQKKNLAVSQTQLSVDKAALALKQASKVLDLQQIEIFAAMQNAKGNDLDRLKLQQAILDGNAASAKTLSDKVLAANGLVMDMQGNIKVDPFASWVTSMDAFGKAAVSALNSLKQIQTQAMLLIPGNTPGSLNSNDLASMGYNTSTNPSGYIAGSPVPSNLTNPDLYYSRAQQEIKVTVDPAAMAYGITLATQNQSSNGTSVATSRNNPTYLNPSSGL